VKHSDNDIGGTGSQNFIMRQSAKARVLEKARLFSHFCAIKQSGDDSWSFYLVIMSSRHINQRTRVSLCKWQHGTAISCWPKKYPFRSRWVSNNPGHRKKEKYITLLLASHVDNARALLVASKVCLMKTMQRFWGWIYGKSTAGAERLAIKKSKPSSWLDGFTALRKMKLLWM
jgi:hypothetical protein